MLSSPAELGLKLGFFGRYDAVLKKSTPNLVNPIKVTRASSPLVKFGSNLPGGRHTAKPFCKERFSLFLCHFLKSFFILYFLLYIISNLRKTAKNPANNNEKNQQKFLRLSRFLSLILFYQLGNSVSKYFTIAIYYNYNI